MLKFFTLTFFSVFFFFLLTFLCVHSRRKSQLIAYEHSYFNQSTKTSNGDVCN